MASWLTFSLFCPVKSSPSKKRRAVAHGPLKKTAGSGPFLMTQTSGNNQHPLLQHQVSTDTIENTEGDNGKSWGFSGFSWNAKQVRMNFVEGYPHRFSPPACTSM